VIIVAIKLWNTEEVIVVSHLFHATEIMTGRQTKRNELEKRFWNRCHSLLWKIVK